MVALNIKDLSNYEMNNPRAGQVFSEHYSFYVHVIYVAHDRVIVEEYSAPCEIPTDRKIRRFASADAFRKAYEYKGHIGYWVMYLPGKVCPLEHVSDEDILFHNELSVQGDTSDFAIEE
jgi:hypothetical protein